MPAGVLSARLPHFALPAAPRADTVPCADTVPRTDPRFGHPVRAEEHQEEQGGEGLALVEALHHSAAPHRGAAHRGPDPRQRRGYLRAGGCWMEQGGLGGVLDPGRTPPLRWDAGSCSGVECRTPTVGWDARSCGGVGCRIILLWQGRMQEPSVGWDAGAQGRVGCRTPQ